MYMDRDSSDRLLTDLSSSFSDATVVIYDPIPQKTRFGTIMCENLRRSGVEVSGMQSLETLKEQVRKGGEQRLGRSDSNTSTIYQYN